MQTKTFDYIALTLIVIGAINWGLIGFFQFDVIAAIFGGSASWISRIIYAVVGIAGLYALTMYSRLTDQSFKA